jgi:hypothetical protein
MPAGSAVLGGGTQIETALPDAAGIAGPAGARTSATAGIGAAADHLAHLSARAGVPTADAQTGRRFAGPGGATAEGVILTASATVRSTDQRDIAGNTGIATALAVQLARREIHAVSTAEGQSVSACHCAARAGAATLGSLTTF